MLVHCRVSTNAAKAGVQEFQRGLKVRVCSKPIEGKANLEVIELVAKHYSIPTSSVEIVSGLKSSKKILFIRK